MKLEDIRFEKQRGDSFFKEVLQNSSNLNLRNILLSKDRELIEIVLAFFRRNKDNVEKMENELERLDYELELKKEIDGVDTNSYNNLVCLKNTLSLIYKFEYNDFKKFRSDFVEYVAFVYFAIMTPFVKNKYNKSRRFFHEPRIVYKATSYLIGESKNLVDLVHVNRKNCIVDLCECKSDLNYFLLHLKTHNSEDHNCRKSIRKWEYMKAVQNYFHKNIESCNCNLYLFTFADTLNNKEAIIDRDSQVTFVTSYDICSAFCN